MAGRLTPMLGTDFSRETGSLVVLVMAGESLARSADFISGEEAREGTGLSVVETSAPLWFWGTLGAMIAVSVIVGMWRQVYEPVIVGALGGTALYLTYAIGYLAAVVERGWPPDGFRTPVWFLVMSMIWGAVLLEMLAGRSIRKNMREGAEADDGPGNSR